MSSLVLASTLLAQEGDVGAEAAAGAAGFILVIYLALIVGMLAGLWGIFSKAGQPGWAAIVPIYNVIVLLQIAGRPLWWILLYFVPLVNIIIPLIVSIDVAKSFGKGAGYGVGMWLLPFVFWPMLGFGSAQYQGPSVAA